jgi:L-aminopeptidase/D-esterase-like protein
MQKIGEQLHDVVQSMIYPYGTTYDGDTFFFVSTHEYKTKKNFIKEYENVVRDAIKSPFQSNV